jgi:hypothetical protein
MNRYVVCTAAIVGTCASLALAQPAGIGAGSNSALIVAQQRPDTAPSDTLAPAEQRAKDLQSQMEINKWQSGPSNGDQSAGLFGSTDEGTSAETRAADLQKQMEIGGWQSGPSAGDAAAAIDTAKSPSMPPVRLDTPEAQRALQDASTP